MFLLVFRCFLLVFLLSKTSDASPGCSIISSAPPVAVGAMLAAAVWTGMRRGTPRAELHGAMDGPQQENSE